jgi:antibiotic biosynthesis monooxygenase (ABM) superfamily enzyme
MTVSSFLIEFFFLVVLYSLVFLIVILHNWVILSIISNIFKMWLVLRKNSTAA